MSGPRMNCTLDEILKILSEELREGQQRFICRPTHAFSMENTTVIGRFTGAIGLPNVNEFSEALHDLLTDSVQKIILDFSRVSLTRTATGSFVSFAGKVFGLNKRLYIYKASQQVKGMLNNLGLTGFFAFLETEESVIATLTV